MVIVVDSISFQLPIAQLPISGMAANASVDHSEYAAAWVFVEVGDACRVVGGFDEQAVWFGVQGKADAATVAGWYLGVNGKARVLNRDTFLICS